MVEAILKPKIKLEKSEFIPIGGIANVDELAMEFSHKVEALPFSYLGLPLGAPFKSISVYDTMEERFCKRLSIWKKQHMSKRRRLTLIRNTLTSTRKAAKRFSLRKWDFGEKVSFCKMGHCAHR